VIRSRVYKAYRIFANLSKIPCETVKFEQDIGVVVDITPSITKTKFHLVVTRKITVFLEGLIFIDWPRNTLL
jgi:hypothetical protein